MKGKAREAVGDRLSRALRPRPGGARRGRRRETRRGALRIPARRPAPIPPARIVTSLPVGGRLNRIVQAASRSMPSRNGTARPGDRDRVRRAARRTARRRAARADARRATVFPSRSAQNGTMMRCAVPQTGSSGRPSFGAKTRMHEVGSARRRGDDDGIGFERGEAVEIRRQAPARPPPRQRRRSSRNPRRSVLSGRRPRLRSSARPDRRRQTA